MTRLYSTEASGITPQGNRIGTDTEEVLAEDLQNVLEERDALRLALLKYGGHHDNCASQRTYGNAACSCGWTAQRHALREGGP